MRLEKTQEGLRNRNLEFQYTEEDGCGSIDFEYRGLSYHIWEYADDDGVICGVETNLFHAGRTEDIEGDYEQIIVEELEKDFR